MKAPCNGSNLNFYKKIPTTIFFVMTLLKDLGIYIVLFLSDCCNNKGFCFLFQTIWPKKLKMYLYLILLHWHFQAGFLVYLFTGDPFMNPSRNMQNSHWNLTCQFQCEFCMFLNSLITDDRILYRKSYSMSLPGHVWSRNHPVLSSIPQGPILTL